MDTRPPLLTRTLAWVFFASVGALTGFYLLLSVVPVYATTAGAGDVGAGLTTAALMMSTVAGELATPRLLRRFGYRAVYAAGLLLLGLPALALLVSASMPLIIAVSLVRGLGFAFAIVVGAALVATLADPSRRGEVLGVYGAVVNIPAIVALPLGLWLSSHVGYPVVFVIAAVSALVGLTALKVLPRSGDDQQHVGVVAGLRNPALLRPALLFAVVAMAAGVAFTFLPLALASASVAAAALFVQSLAMTASRWWAGHAGDRHGAGRLLLPAIVLASVGMLVLLGVPAIAATLVGMLLFGLGFGIAQNATLALMFERVPAAGYGMVSAVWNLAYDLGLGVGAGVFGVVAATTGYPVAFGLTGALVAATLLVAFLDRRASSDPSRQ